MDDNRDAKSKREKKSKGSESINGNYVFIFIGLQNIVNKSC